MKTKKRFLYLCEARQYFRECLKRGENVKLYHWSGNDFPYTVREVENEPKIYAK
jgi:hypothetical protein